MTRIASGLARVLRILALLLAAGSCIRTPHDSTNVIAIIGAKVYPGDTEPPLDSGVILIRDDLIVSVGSPSEVSVPAGAKRVDYSGLVALPAFWNSHVHFTELHWARADTQPADTLTARLEAMLTRYGFVRVLDTGSELENTLALRRRIDRGEVLGPAIRTTGPGFVPREASPFYIRPARLPELHSPGSAKAEVSARIGQGADAIKLFTGSYAAPTRVVPMPLEVVRAATDEAHRLDRLVVAHPSNDEGLESAVQGGVDMLAHTAPDGKSWEAALTKRMKDAHLALIPTLKLWSFELSRRGVDSAAQRRFLNVGIGQLRAYVLAGGEILFGTDVGYMTDYDPADEYVYMQQAGMSFRQILAALTSAPARRLGPVHGGRTTGRLEPGVEADIVLLDGDPALDVRAFSRVRSVFRRGREIFTAARAGQRHLLPDPR